MIARLPVPAVFTVAAIASAFATVLVWTPAAADFIETPALARAVAEGRLPPVAQRLPQAPRIIDPAAAGGSNGVHGGTLRLLMSQPKDTRMMVVYGYSRLVGYTADWTIAPDILASVQIEEGRVFTLRLRPGHRWSDGAPFTSEDFRFWWEDVANNADLSPGGPERYLLVDGERPQVSFPDATTVRYAWSKPNPFFLPALAGSRPEYIFLPAHYLKAFHPAYTDKDTLKAKVKEANGRNWTSLFNQKGSPYRNDNPELPSLEPWVLATTPPSTRFLFARNPYFHRIDTAGRQLPYIDEVAMMIVGAGLIPAKTAAGDADLQARNLSFENYTVLKQGEARHPFTVRLWKSAQGSALALYPNLNATDPVWRTVLRDVRFRRALSLAIDRHEINEVVYYGLAQEGNDTVLPDSPLYEPLFSTAFAGYDLAAASRLLDEMGLGRRGSGTRTLADGQPLTLVAETAGEDPTQVAILQLIRDTWQEIGIQLLIKPEQRELMRNRVFSGDAILSAWTGLENGLPTPQLSPQELAPTSQQQLCWPKWGLYYETNGRTGEPVDLVPARDLLDLNAAWVTTADVDRQREIWQRMLTIRAEQAFSIGTVRGVPQPVVVNSQLRNVPAQGIYNWEPGSFFGVYQPDTFWFDVPAPLQPTAEKKDAQLPGP
ncbi:MAG: ABC transporter substrate-binding protein [Rhodospirillales bacterium]